MRGAKVRSVEEGSPAEKAGIKEGDVIVRFDGEAVRSASQLARLVGETPAGRSVAIDVDRGGATQKLTATLAEGKRRVRVFGGKGFPGMREFNLEMPEWDVEVPEPPSPPERGAARGARTRPWRPRADAAAGAGRATTGTTWSSACWAAVRAGWASSTWRSASSWPATSSSPGRRASSSARWTPTGRPARRG